MVDTYWPKGQWTQVSIATTSPVRILPPASPLRRGDAWSGRTLDCHTCDTQDRAVGWSRSRTDDGRLRRFTADLKESHNKY
jgi:hypothetical protein